MNYLRVGSLILAPTFGLPEDDLAVSLLEKTFPTARIVHWR